MILKFFKFLKNSMDFVRIIILLIVILFLFYWVKTLTGSEMAFLNFAFPLLKCLVGMGNALFSGSTTILNAVFEYKFFGGLVILGIVYSLTNVGDFLIDRFEEYYNSGRLFIRKKQEDAMNASLQKELKVEQKKYKGYKVYVGLSVKQKYGQQLANIDIKEQNQILNKFLIEKLSVLPTTYDEGFIYSFGNFETLDNTLNVFFKVLQSSAPVNYFICVQAYGVDFIKENAQLKNMISLKIANKIIAMPDTIFRYQTNTYNKNGTSCLGVFKANDVSFEVHEFNKD